MENLIARRGRKRRMKNMWNEVLGMGFPWRILTTKAE
jgi:hypothetical protein